MLDTNEEKQILKNWLKILIKKLTKKINKKMKGINSENDSLIDKATTFVEKTLLAKIDVLTNFNLTDEVQTYFSIEDLFKESTTMTGFRNNYLTFLTITS